MTLLVLFLNQLGCLGQGDSILTENKKKTRRLILGTSLSYAATYSYLGAIWYQNQQLTNFHWFDDWKEWKQMDKFGHAFGAYQESRIMMKLLQRAGANQKKILILGGLTGVMMQSPVEILDGFASKWGASWGDLTFNALGSTIAISNEILWHEQRLHLKYWFMPSSFMRESKSKALGTGADRLIKDYNAQSYWLSIRVHSFLNEQQKKYYPKWLNFAIGYSADNLAGNYHLLPMSEINKYESRNIYLSLDIDLEQIKTKHKGLKVVFFALNAIRIPLPAVQINNRRLGLKSFF